MPDIVRSAWCWRRFTEAALDGLDGLPDGRTLELRYESMVGEPGAAAGQLAGFLGTTPAGERALRDALAGARASSVGRWRGKLGAAEQAAVESEIGPLLARLGYAAADGRPA